jgi:hypothetical protein
MQIPVANRFRSRHRCRGIVLMEISAALGLLLILSVLLLKASINVLSVQRWTVVQGMTDAFIARETALGKRLPFSDITDASSIWPTEPTVNTSTVTVGLMPGGRPLTATMRRSKAPAANNMGLGGDTSNNPAKMESWQLKSYLSYQISGRTYVKARTIVRTQ